MKGETSGRTYKREATRKWAGAAVGHCTSSIVLLQGVWSRYEGSHLSHSSGKGENCGCGLEAGDAAKRNSSTIGPLIISRQVWSVGAAARQLQYSCIVSYLPFLGSHRAHASRTPVPPSMTIPPSHLHPRVERSRANVMQCAFAPTRPASLWYHCSGRGADADEVAPWQMPSGAD